MTSNTTAPRSPARVPKRPGTAARFFVRLVKEKPLGMTSGIVIVLLIVVALFGDQLAPYPYNEMHLSDRLSGPSSQYLLGTDQTGRDVLSRIIFGARISILVGLTVTTISVIISTLMGGISGFVGGKPDMIVQRLVDSWIAFPGLLLMLTVISIVGKGLLQIILISGISGGIAGARVIRSAVIGIRESIYFEMAEAVGSSRWRSFIRHVLPNITPVIIISFSTSVGGVIMALGFAGLPGIRSATRHSRLGRYAESGRAQVHGGGAVDRALAGSLLDGHHLQSEYVRRCRARLARPAAQGGDRT